MCEWKRLADELPPEPGQILLLYDESAGMVSSLAVMVPLDEEPGIIEVSGKVRFGILSGGGSIVSAPPHTLWWSPIQAPPVQIAGEQDGSCLRPDEPGPDLRSTQ
jgi:hypothetical protein